MVTTVEIIKGLIIGAAGIYLYIKWDKKQQA